MRMAMKFIGDIKKDIDRDIASIEQSAMSAAKAVADGAKQDWRAQIAAAGLGKRMENTVRSRVYPTGRKSFSPAGFVWTKAPEIMRSFDQGVTISPTGRGSKYIAVPTKFAPTKGDKLVGERKGIYRERISPSNWPHHQYGVLVFVEAKGSRPAMLVVEDMRRASVKSKGRNRRGRQFKKASTKWKGSKFIVPMFILLPRVKMPKLLTVQGIEEKWGAKFPELLDREMTSRGVVK